MEEGSDQLARYHAQVLAAWLAELQELPAGDRMRALLMAAAEEAVFAVVKPATEVDRQAAALKDAGPRLLAKRRTFVRALVSLVRELRAVRNH